MAIIEYRSTMSVERLKRKHTKESLAWLLVQAYRHMAALEDVDLPSEHEVTRKRLMDRMAWG